MTAQDRAIAELRDVAARAKTTVGHRRHEAVLITINDLDLLADAATTLADVMDALKGNNNDAASA